MNYKLYRLHESSAYNSICKVMYDAVHTSIYLFLLNYPQWSICLTPSSAPSPHPLHCVYVNLSHPWFRCFCVSFRKQLFVSEIKFFSFWGIYSNQRMYFMMPEPTVIHSRRNSSTIHSMHVSMKTGCARLFVSCRCRRRRLLTVCICIACFAERNSFHVVHSNAKRKWCHKQPPATTSTPDTHTPSWLHLMHLHERHYSVSSTPSLQQNLNMYAILVWLHFVKSL